MNRMKILRLRKAIVKGSESLNDETATTVPELFNRWETGMDYVIGDRRTHNGILYKCIQPHTSQSDWTPDVAVSLWTVTTTEEWPEWVQPTGMHDAYDTGAKVTHNSSKWISDIDDNVWEPGVYGWNVYEG